MKEPLDQPITVEELLARCMGDRDFSRSILDGFVSSSQPQLDEIALDIAEGADPLLTAKKVHRLKGTAATVGAGRLRTTLEELEAILRNPEQTGSGDAGVDELAEQALVQFREVAEFAVTCLQ